MCIDELRFPKRDGACGSFGRSYLLPENASPGKVRAGFKDGGLTVHPVKDEKSKAESG